MSLFRSIHVVCPGCGEAITMDAVGSINADRRPDYRDAILEDRFQDAECDSCHEKFRLQPQFNYLDAGRGQWIAGMPAMQLRDYLHVEDEVGEIFAKSYGKKAPKAAQDVGELLEVRLTFGWPAIREKILIKAEGLDDVIVEMVKLDLLRRLPQAPLAEGTEMRLVGVEGGDTFVLVWMDTATETVKQQVRVNRELYDVIAADEKGWAKTRARLVNGPFVDMQKLYMGPGRAVAAQ